MRNQFSSDKPRGNPKDAPYGLSRSALREFYGARRIEASDPLLREKNKNSASGLASDADYAAYGKTNNSDWRKFFGPIADPEKGWGVHGKEDMADRERSGSSKPKANNPAVFDLAGPDQRMPNAVTDFPLNPDGSLGQPGPSEAMEPPPAASMLSGPDWAQPEAWDSGSIYDQTIANAEGTLNFLTSNPTTANKLAQIGGSYGWDEPLDLYT